MSNTDIIYGLHAVKSVLDHHPEAILQLFVQEGRDDQRLQDIIDQANKLALTIIKVSRLELDKKAATVYQGAVHQGIVSVCKPIKLEKTEAFLNHYLDNLDRPPFLLILDGVTDPHNLGACLRSAEAAGVDAVIVPKDKSALMNATVRKVACGAAEIVPFVVVTNLTRCLQSLQKKGIWIFGTAGEAEQNLYQSDLSGSIALVLGSEGKGMRRLTRDNCDTLLAIPLAGEVSSLNVSVSAGVCLFEAVRQRQTPT